MKNYISQSNRLDEFALIIKKHEEMQNNHILASLHQTSFSELIESIEEDEKGELIIKDVDTDNEGEP